MRRCLHLGHGGRDPRHDAVLLRGRPLDRDIPLPPGLVPFGRGAIHTLLLLGYPGRQPRLAIDRPTFPGLLAGTAPTAPLAALETERRRHLLVEPVLKRAHNALPAVPPVVVLITCNEVPPDPSPAEPHLTVGHHDLDMAMWSRLVLVQRGANHSRSRTPSTHDELHRRREVRHAHLLL